MQHYIHQEVYSFRIPNKEIMLHSISIPTNQAHFHWHSEVELILVHSGQVQIYIMDNLVTVNSGQILYLSPMTVHRLKFFDSSCTQISKILFSPSFIYSPLDPLLSKQLQPFMKNPNIPYQILDSNFKYYYDLCHLTTLLVTPKDFDFIEIKAILFHLFCHMIKENQQLLQSPSALLHESKKLEPIIHFIYQSYSKPISVHKLAQLMNLNPCYFSTYFKKILGISPVQYIINVRLQMAALLLQGTCYKIIDISLDCGFTHVSHFTTLFKRHYGVTPSQYRHNFLIHPPKKSNEKIA